MYGRVIIAEQKVLKFLVAKNWRQIWDSVFCLFVCLFVCLQDLLEATRDSWQHNPFERHAGQSFQHTHAQHKVEMEDTHTNSSSFLGLEILNFGLA